MNLKVEHLVLSNLKILGATPIFAGYHKKTKIPLVLEINIDPANFKLFNYDEVIQDMIDLNEEEKAGLYKDILEEKKSLYKQLKEGGVIK